MTSVLLMLIARPKQLAVYAKRLTIGCMRMSSTECAMSAQSSRKREHFLEPDVLSLFVLSFVVG